MKQAIRSMGKRYNSWREKPLVVPITTSARAVLRETTTKNISGSSCKGACGSECEIQTCVSCKVD